MKSTRNGGLDQQPLPLSEVVDQLIDRGMKALDAGKLKVTVADLFRATERHKELAPKQPSRDVTWEDS